MIKLVGGKPALVHSVADGYAVGGLFQLLPDALYHIPYLFFIRPDAKDYELVPADAVDMVLSPGRRDEAVGKGLERPVTLGMSEAVVGALEAVHVDSDHCRYAVLIPFKIGVIALAVQQAGKGIAGGKALQQENIVKQQLCRYGLLQPLIRLCLKGQRHDDAGRRHHSHEHRPHQLPPLPAPALEYSEAEICQIKGVDDKRQIAQRPPSEVVGISEGKYQSRGYRNKDHDRIHGAGDEKEPLMPRINYHGNADENDRQQAVIDGT